jgi:predicted nucleic acid-binding protein
MAKTTVRTAIDSSYIVALLLEWHEHHDATLADFESRVAAGDVLVIPAHCVLESYSVMTRLPAPLRVTPSDAMQLLSRSFADRGEPAILTTELVWKVLASLSALGYGGGQVYDAAIGHTAANAGATSLRTWNTRDMQRVAPPSLEIRTPAPASQD